MNRSQILLEGLDPSKHRGIEIGPWYAPIAAKCDGWQTCVVDAFDTSVLQERAVTHSDEAVRNMAERIEEVDVMWNGEPLGELPDLVRRGPFHYIIGSHVLEHVPDLVRFLRGLSDVLSSDGVVSLALPDARFCFDALRPLSTSADALGAFREARTRHIPETLFSNIAYGVHVEGRGAWEKGTSGEAKLMSDLSWALQNYDEYLLSLQSSDAAYVDCHAWVFTPSSFNLLILELFSIGLIDLTVTSTDRVTLASEFFVKMKRMDHGVGQEDLPRRRLGLMLDVRREMSQFPLSNSPVMQSQDMTNRADQAGDE